MIFVFLGAFTSKHTNASHYRLIKEIILNDISLTSKTIKAQQKPRIVCWLKIMLYHDVMMLRYSHKNHIILD